MKKKKKMGRPSKLATIDLSQVEKLASEGLINTQIANVLDISASSLTNYMKPDSEFLLAIKKGKAIADAKVEKSLYKRALGYSYDEVTYEKIAGKVNLKLSVSDEAINDIKTEDSYRTKVVIKQLPPETLACIFWLKNRKPEDWRESKEIHQIIEERRSFKDKSNEELDKEIGKHEG